MAFNHNATAPLGILPHFPITLGGKIVYIDVMVIQGPLDLNFLIGRDYVYIMKAVVCTLFIVMHFPHDGNIVTIDQLSFVKPNHCVTPSHHNSLNVPHVLVVPSPSLPMSLDFDHHAKVQTFVNR